MVYVLVYLIIVCQYNIGTMPYIHIEYEYIPILIECILIRSSYILIITESVPIRIKYIFILIESILIGWPVALSARWTTRARRCPY
jgi:hypothetical protein